MVAHSLTATELLHRLGLFLAGVFLVWVFVWRSVRFPLVSQPDL